MLCDGCGLDNREDARFCGECGNTLLLEVVCANCGRSSPGGRRFCDGCGQPLRAPMAPAANPRTYTPRHLAERILTARSALEGERKQVTILFADVQRSMELAEQVDAEEWHRLLDRFFQILSQGVHRFEGTINQYTGDGVMALFGAPLAHEDHAQRACHAALHLRGALQRFGDELRVSHGLNFSVRMGLNSGDVVVGKIGDDLRMDYTAQGPTVGLAARMEQLAEGGKVLLTDHTAKLVRGYFALRDLGTARIKGVAEPVAIYELEGTGELLTRFDLSRARGLSHFVGRAAEMQTLDAALARAVAGEASIVGVVAEAGTGKSRLCHELAKRCRASGIAVYEGHALSHARMVPLLPLIELLRGVFGIVPQDRPEAARQKIAGTIVLLDPELQPSLPLWFDFLGVPDPAHRLPQSDPEAHQQRLWQATRRLFLARGRSAPAVLLIEDLHWLDEASEALLASLVEFIPSSRLLLLLNFRPEYRAAWMGRADVPYTEIALRPLGGEAVDALLDTLVGSGEALAELRRQIRESTGGSPFFVEEVVRSLFDQGVLVSAANGAILAREIEHIEIPPTVQAVLAARIDRLAEPCKHVLQTAAAVGKSFDETVLRRVLVGDADGVSDALGVLVAEGFLVLEGVAPEPRYGFRHPLTQEVAYRSQLSERRARVHAAVAEAIEAEHQGRALDEQAALLAHHYAGAGEILRAAEWHRRAAEWIGMRDRRAMMRHWQQVCELAESVPPSPEADALGVTARQRMMMNGIFIGMTRERIQKLFDEGMERALRLPTIVPTLLLQVSLGLTRMFCGEPAESVRHLREALRIADEAGQRVLRYITRVSLAAPLIHAGELREALEMTFAAEALSGGDHDLGSEYTRLSPYGVILAHRGQALINLGRPLEVTTPLAQAFEIGTERNDPELIEMSHVFRAHAADLLGEGDTAEMHARRAIEVAEQVDSAQLLVGAFGALGCSYSGQGRLAEAEEALSASLDVMRTGHTGLFLESIRLADRADVRMRRGNVEGARADVEHGESVARARGARVALLRLLPLRSQLERLAGAPVERLEVYLDEAATLAEQTGGFAWLPLIHLERAEIAKRRGDSAAATAALQKARQLYLDMGAVSRAEKVGA